MTPPPGWAAAPQSPPESDDEAFRDAWRTHLLARAWEALAEEEQRLAKPLHLVLR